MYVPKTKKHKKNTKRNEISKKKRLIESLFIMELIISSDRSRRVFTPHFPCGMSLHIVSPSLRRPHFRKEYSTT